MTTQMNYPALPLLAHSRKFTARCGVSFPALGPSDVGPPHSHPQGQLYCFAQTRSKALSPDCCRGNKRTGGRVRSPDLIPSVPLTTRRSHSPVCCSWYGAWLVLSPLLPLGQLIHLSQVARGGQGRLLSLIHVTRFQSGYPAHPPRAVLRMDRN